MRRHYISRWHLPPLGTPCVSPHFCHYGEALDSLGYYGISCSRNAGRLSRYISINDITRRALVIAYDKRPGGLLPWKMNKPLVKDATCIDSLAPSHLPSTAGYLPLLLHLRKVSNVISCTYMLSDNR